MHRLMTGSSTSFYVGPQKKHYTIPKRLLYHFSDFAKACLESSFSEAGANAIFLPDVDPDVFQYLWLWLYTGELKVYQLDYCAWAISSAEGLVQACRTLCRVHTLGERLLFDYRFLELVVQDQLTEIIDEAKTNRKLMPLSPEIVGEVLTDSAPARYGACCWHSISLRPFVVKHLCTFQFCTTVDFMDYADSFKKDGGFAIEILIFVAGEIRWAKDRGEAEIGGPVDVFREEQVTENQDFTQCIGTRSKLSQGVWVVLKHICTFAECSTFDLRAFSSLFELDGEFAAEFLNYMATELLLTVKRWGEERGKEVDFTAEKEEEERLAQEADDLERTVQRMMFRWGWY